MKGIILKTGKNVWVIFNEETGWISDNYYSWSEAFTTWREILNERFER